MKEKQKSIALALVATAIIGFQTSASATVIAGVDFEDGSGGFSVAPDDLNLSDDITVSSGWSPATIDLGEDNNANTAGAYEGNFPGRLDGNGSWSITIPVGVEVDLDQFFFAARGATGSTGGSTGRQVRFRTSLDGPTEWLFEDTSLPARDNDTTDDPSEWMTANINLTDAKYDGLTDTTIDFVFDTQGAVDLDGILVYGTVVPEPSAFALIAGCFGLTWVMLRRR